MDHGYIEEFNIADRYLLGKLPMEERVRFEEHFVDCPHCLDLLETTERFRGGLRSVAVEEAARSSAYFQVGLFAWVGRLNRRQAMLLVSAILLLMILPTTYLVIEMRRMRGELEQTKLASAEWQRQYEEKRQAAQRVEKEQQEAEQKTAEQRQQLEAQLERERQERARLAEAAKKPEQRSSLAIVFPLSLVRSADPIQSASVNQITIPRSSQVIVLAPELEPDPDIRAYRGVITTADKRLVWQGDKLRPNSQGVIKLPFKSRFFQAGDYLLTIEGLTRQGRYEVLARCPFNVSKK